MPRSAPLPRTTLALAVALWVSACGLDADASGQDGPVGVEVRPPSAVLGVGAQQAFTAAVSNATDTSVTWTVEPAGCGTISGAGLYAAPASATTCRVRATSNADRSRSGSAAVTVLAGTPPGEVVAFPGAEGFGARATGGRGGRVIRVTNLNASGPGSLQAALDVNAPRIVVFAVSGVIRGDVTVTYGNVTIAGQTAPGGGITIAGGLYGEYSSSVQNIIVRHVRVRPPRCPADCAQFDAIQFSRNRNFILDHVSVAYGADETVDVYEAWDATIQWSTIETSQLSTLHPDYPQLHNYGIISGPDAQRITFHHNLCAHHSRRCPAIANGPADVRNNVAYNARHAFLHTNPAVGDFNLVGNYFKDGPSAAIYPYYFDDEGPNLADTRYHTRDSYVDDPAHGHQEAVDNVWSVNWLYDLALDASHYSATEFDFAAVVPGYVRVTTTSSTAAYADVLARAGAWPRDAFTLQVLAETQNRTGAWDTVGAPVNLPADLMAGLTPGTPPADLDGDGMADAWETAHGLDPSNGADHSTVMPSGYTAIEEYVNQLADALEM